MSVFFLGAISAGAVVAGLFFLRFYRDSGDRLFLLFAIAFWLEALGRILLATQPDPREGDPLIYVLRFVAYGTIIAAIVDKNLAGRRAG